MSSQNVLRPILQLLISEKKSLGYNWNLTRTENIETSTSPATHRNIIGSNFGPQTSGLMALGAVMIILSLIFIVIILLCYLRRRAKESEWFDRIPPLSRQSSYDSMHSNSSIELLSQSPPSYKTCVENTQPMAVPGLRNDMQAKNVIAETPPPKYNDFL